MPGLLRRQLLVPGIATLLIANTAP